MAHPYKAPKRPKIHFPDYGSRSTITQDNEIEKNKKKVREEFDPKKLCIRADAVYLESVRKQVFDRFSLQGLEFFYLLGLNLLEIFEEQLQYEAYIKSARKTIQDLIDYRFDLGYWKASEDQIVALEKAVEVVTELTLNVRIGEVITNSVKAVKLVNQDIRFGSKYQF